MLTVHCHKTLVGKIKSKFTTHLDITGPFHTSDIQEKKCLTNSIYMTKAKLT